MRARVSVTVAVVIAATLLLLLIAAIAPCCNKRQALIQTRRSRDGFESEPESVGFLDDVNYKTVASFDAVAYPLAAHVRWSITEGEGRIYLFIDGEWEQRYIHTEDYIQPLPVGPHTLTLAVYRNEYGEGDTDTAPLSHKTVSVDIPCHPNHHEDDATGECTPVDCEPQNHRYMYRTETGGCEYSDECVPGFELVDDACSPVPCLPTTDNRLQERQDDGSCAPIQECVDGHVVNENNWSRGCIPLFTECRPRHPHPHRKWFLNEDSGFCEPSDECLLPGFVPLDGQDGNDCVPFDHPCDPPNDPVRNVVLRRSGTGECVPTVPLRCADGYVALDGDAVSNGCVPFSHPCEPDASTGRAYERDSESGVCRPMEACVDGMAWVADGYGRAGCRRPGDPCHAPPDLARGQRLEWRSNYAGLRAVAGMGQPVACMALEECVADGTGFYGPDLETPCKTIGEECPDAKPESDARPHLWHDVGGGRVDCLPTVEVGAACAGQHDSVQYAYQTSPDGAVRCEPAACADAAHVPMDGDYGRGCVPRDSCEHVRSDFVMSRNDLGFCEETSECREGLVPLDGNASEGCVPADHPCPNINGISHSRNERGVCVSGGFCADGLVPLDGQLREGCVPRDHPCDPLYVQDMLMVRNGSGVCEKADECRSSDYVMNRSGTACVPRSPDCPPGADNRVRTANEYGECVAADPMQCAPGFVPSADGRSCEAEPSCPDGSFVYEGECVPPGGVCPDSSVPNGAMHMSASGQCTDLRCNTGYQEIDGGCVLREFPGRGVQSGPDLELDPIEPVTETAPETEPETGTETETETETGTGSGSQIEDGTPCMAGDGITGYVYGGRCLNVHSECGPRAANGYGKRVVIFNGTCQMRCFPANNGQRSPDDCDLACFDGFQLSDDGTECVYMCPDEGSYYDMDTEQCVWNNEGDECGTQDGRRKRYQSGVCAVTDEWLNEGQDCVTDDHFLGEYASGECVPSGTCRHGFERVGSRCKPLCPAWHTRDAAGDCVSDRRPDLCEGGGADQAAGYDRVGEFEVDTTPIGAPEASETGTVYRGGQVYAGCAAECAALCDASDTPCSAFTYLEPVGDAFLTQPPCKLMAPEPGSRFSYVANQVTASRRAATWKRPRLDWEPAPGQAQPPPPPAEEASEPVPAACASGAQVTGYEKVADYRVTGTLSSGAAASCAAECAELCDADDACNAFMYTTPKPGKTQNVRPCKLMSVEPGSSYGRPSEESGFWTYETWKRVGLEWPHVDDAPSPPPQSAPPPSAPPSEGDECGSAVNGTLTIGPSGKCDQKHCNDGYYRDGTGRCLLVAGARGDTPPFSVPNIGALAFQDRDGVEVTLTADWAARNSGDRLGYTAGDADTLLHAWLKPGGVTMSDGRVVRVTRMSLAYAPSPEPEERRGLPEGYDVGRAALIATVTVATRAATQWLVRWFGPLGMHFERRENIHPAGEPYTGAGYQELRGVLGDAPSYDQLRLKSAPRAIRRTADNAVHMFQGPECVESSWIPPSGVALHHPRYYQFTADMMDMRGGLGDLRGVACSGPNLVGFTPEMLLRDAWARDGAPGVPWWRVVSAAPGACPPGTEFLPGNRECVPACGEGLVRSPSGGCVDAGREAAAIPLRRAAYMWPSSGAVISQEGAGSVDLASLPGAPDGRNLSRFGIYIDSSRPVEGHPHMLEGELAIRAYDGAYNFVAKGSPRPVWTRDTQNRHKCVILPVLSSSWFMSYVIHRKSGRAVLFNDVGGRAQAINVSDGALEYRPMTQSGTRAIAADPSAPWLTLEGVDLLGEETRCVPGGVCPGTTVPTMYAC